MPEPQLYDLDRDPAETIDLARQHPDVVQSLAEKAQAFDLSLQRDLRRQERNQ